MNDMKKRDSKEQTVLTDAELRQTTGSMRADVARRVKAKQDSCHAYTYERDCLAHDCKWKENHKDSYDCSY